MSDTYTKLVYHIVFSTKERAPTITGDICSTLYEYMGAIIRSKGGSLLEVGGMPDHVHLLARSKADIAVSDLVGSVKANSSRWLNDYPRSTPFAWQAGYGAFSVSESQIAVVRRYIQRQQEHHARTSFRDELIELLERHGIEYDERYLWA